MPDVQVLQPAQPCYAWRKLVRRPCFKACVAQNKLPERPGCQIGIRADV